MLNKTMNIYSPPGTKIIFAYPNNGWVRDSEFAQKAGLVVNNEYTVEEIEIHQSSSYVYLKEVPRDKFNTSLFADVAEDKKPIKACPSKDYVMGKIEPMPRDEILDRLDELALVSAAFKSNRDKKLPVYVLRKALIEAAKDFVCYLEAKIATDKWAKEEMMKVFAKKESYDEFGNKIK